MTIKEQERNEAIERLKSMLKPGQTVYTVLRHVSASGMSRRIDVYTFNKDGSKNYLSYNVAKALGYTLTDDGIRVGGTGMDMGFHLVYTLSRTLFRDGFRCTGKNCVANDHFNEGTPRDGKRKHRGDGGYALRQEWI